MALSQTKPVEAHFHLEPEQKAEADWLLENHGEASCCLSQASLPGRGERGLPTEEFLSGVRTTRWECWVILSARSG